MKRAHVLILLTVGAFSRLAPLLWNGVPFSTDACPLIENVEILLEESPIHLGSQVLGGYGNFWPASQIFGTVFSQVTSFNAAYATAIGVPLANATVVLAFYGISRKVTGDGDLSFLTSLVFALAYPLTVFYSGATKETFAVPFLFLLIFLFLREKRGTRDLLLVFLFSGGLVLAHHFTSLMGLAVLGSGALTLSAKRFGRKGSVKWSDLLFPLVLGALFAAYYLLFAHGATFSLPGVSEWISAGSYQLVFLALGMVFPLLIPLSAFGIVSSAAVVGLNASLLPGLPVLSPKYLLFGSFFFLLTLTGVIGVRTGRGGDRKRFVVAWLGSTMAVLVYALMTGTYRSTVLMTRSVSFILAPLIILSGLGLSRIYDTDRVFARPLAAIAVALIIFSSVFCFYLPIKGKGRYLGSQYAYTEEEYDAYRTISHHLKGGVAADRKVGYVLDHYLGENVNPVSGYTYLSGIKTQAPPKIVLYEDMFRNGYVIGLYPRTLPKSWGEKLENMSLVYSNGNVEVFEGPRSRDNIP